VPFGFAMFGIWDLVSTSKVGGIWICGIWDLDPHPKLGDLDLHCLGFGI